MYTPLYGRYLRRYWRPLLVQGAAALLALWGGCLALVMLFGA